MRRRRNSTIFEKLLVVVLLAGLIGGGYLTWQRITAKPAVDNSAPVKLDYASPAPTTAKAPVITSTAGLGQAMDTLNNTNVLAGNIDSAQLGVQASAF
jgi:hypothetical protein